MQQIMSPREQDGKRIWERPEYGHVNWRRRAALQLKRTSADNIVISAKEQHHNDPAISEHHTQCDHCQLDDYAIYQSIRGLWRHLRSRARAIKCIKSYPALCNMGTWSDGLGRSCKRWSVPRSRTCVGGQRRLYHQCNHKVYRLRRTVCATLRQFHTSVCRSRVIRRRSI